MGSRPSSMLATTTVVARPPSRRLAHQPAAVLDAPPPGFRASRRRFTAVGGATLPAAWQRRQEQRGSLTLASGARGVSLNGSPLYCRTIWRRAQQEEQGEGGGKEGGWSDPQASRRTQGGPASCPGPTKQKTDRRRIFKQGVWPFFMTDDAARKEENDEATIKRRRAGPFRSRRQSRPAVCGECGRV